MDYKYIDQLLARYWDGETSLEEEQILRSFFSQESVPERLQKYRALFAYEQAETKDDVLGDDFDERMLAMIGEEQPAKARVVSLRQRFAPLLKAAASVAILLALTNVAQLSFTPRDNVDLGVLDQNSRGVSVALTDSSRVDSLKQSNLDITQQPELPVLK